MLTAGLLVAMIATCSYGCEYEMAYKKLFYFIEQSNVTFSDEDRTRHAEEMAAFIEEHRFIKEDRIKTNEAYGPGIADASESVVATVCEVKPRKLLELNSSYHTIYPSSLLNPKLLTTLAYACSLVTCDHRIVEALCKAGADPNFKNSYGLYPATCCLKGMIRFYTPYDDNKPFNTHPYFDNQVIKFGILYDHVHDFNGDGNKILFLDDDIKQLLTEDIKYRQRDLLGKCTYPSKPVQKTT
jgi:hypothetical protein